MGLCFVTHSDRISGADRSGIQTHAASGSRGLNCSGGSGHVCLCRILLFTCRERSHTVTDSGAFIKKRKTLSQTCICDQTRVAVTELHHRTIKQHFRTKPGPGNNMPALSRGTRAVWLCRIGAFKGKKIQTGGAEVGRKQTPLRHVFRLSKDPFIFCFGRSSERREQLVANNTALIHLLIEILPPRHSTCPPRSRCCLSTMR